jgi:hypothetical protein
LAQDRLPLGNMFEVTSLMALVGVGHRPVGYLQFVRRRRSSTGSCCWPAARAGFAADVRRARSADADPRHLVAAFHVSLLVAAMGIFAAGFVFNGLYLLRDTAERAVAAPARARERGSTVGAAHRVGDLERTDPSTDGDRRSLEVERALDRRLPPGAAGGICRG